MAALRKMLDELIKQTPMCDDCKLKIQTALLEFWKYKRKKKL